MVLVVVVVVVVVVGVVVVVRGAGRWGGVRGGDGRLDAGWIKHVARGLREGCAGAGRYGRRGTSGAVRGRYGRRGNIVFSARVLCLCFFAYARCLCARLMWVTYWYLYRDRLIF